MHCNFLCKQYGRRQHKETKRGRRQNFSLNEMNIIQNQVQLNPILEAKHSTTVTNKKKQEIWSRITNMVNAVGVSERSVNEVRDKWRNMCRDAKSQYSEFRRQSQKTGGGPPPAPLSQTVHNVIDMYRDSSSFSGVVGGIETPILESFVTVSSGDGLMDCSDQWEDALDVSPLSPECSAPGTLVVTERPESPAASQCIPSNSNTGPTTSQQPSSSATNLMATPSFRTNSTTMTEDSATTGRPVTVADRLSMNIRPGSTTKQKPKPKRTSDEDVRTLQCAVLEKELEKNNLQIELLKILIEKSKRTDQLSVSELFQSMS